MKQQFKRVVPYETALWYVAGRSHDIPIRKYVISCASSGSSRNFQGKEQDFCKTIEC